METIETIQLVGYVISIIVCTVLAVFFLRKFLNKRLRASLWWAAGFSSLACGILAAAVGAFYGVHTILVIAFVFVAASVAFLYYAASLLFLDRGSFFREKFTVILFLVSFVLFVLPVYFLFEKYVTTMRSPTMTLFVIAFLVIAVLFNRTAAKLSEEYLCKILGALQSLAWWVAAVWSLYIASLWGSVTAAGFVFVLSSFEFVLLWYGCKGGDNMDRKDHEDAGEVYYQEINGVENKVNLEAHAAQERLDDSMKILGDTLLLVRIEEEKTLTREEIMNRASKIGIEGNLRDEVCNLAVDILEHKKGPTKKEVMALTSETEKEDHLAKDVTRFLDDIYEQRKDYTREEMVVRASEIGIKEKRLVECVAELTKTTLELVRSFYRLLLYGDRVPYQTDGGNEEPLSGGVDKIPYAQMGEKAVTSYTNVSQHATKIIAILARTRESTDRDMIKSCCDLVIDICSLENNAVTEYKWKGLPDDEHPGGMIGYTYNVLNAIDKKPIDKKPDLLKQNKYAQDFRDTFQEGADELFEKTETLRTNTNNLVSSLPPPPETPTEEQAGLASSYLSDTVFLLDDASKLLSDASEFVSGKTSSISSID